MGIVVVGGMLSSTFLTLLVIPMAYTLFTELSRRVTDRPAAAQAKRATVSEPQNA